MRTVPIVACMECQVHWLDGTDPPGCQDPDHTHRRFLMHQHHSSVVLPHGTPILAASFDEHDPYSRERNPDYGLYLDPRWQPPWEHDHLDWPDFGIPPDAESFLVALRNALIRARAGQLVEIGCGGGHGRTGTALASLAALSGVSKAEAVGWVRRAYCTEAIETPEQEAFVAGLENPCEKTS